MRKTLAVLIAGGMVAGAMVMPADAAKKKKKKKVTKVEREAEATYANPAIGIGGVVSSGAAGGSMEFPLMPNEEYISLEIVDATGGDVYASLSQDTDPSTPSWEIFAGICGSTDEPIKVAPGITVRVTITAGPGTEAPTCAGTPTSGTVKAVLSNLP